MRTCISRVAFIVNTLVRTTSHIDKYHTSEKYHDVHNGNNHDKGYDDTIY